MMNEPPVAIVTGASRGIGLAIAEKLHQQGFRVMMTSRDRTRLKSAVADLIDQHGCPERLRVQEAEATDEDALRAVVGTTIRHWGQLDLLVNNAGTGVFGPIETLTTRDWDRVMAVNVRAPFVLIQESIPHLAVRKRAWIINIASVVAHKGYEHQSLYGASKHALLGMSKSLGRELHDRGIRVHVISPGGVDTDMIGDARPDLDRTSLMRPETVADTVTYLLSLPPSAAVDEICLRRDGSLPWA